MESFRQVDSKAVKITVKPGHVYPKVAINKSVSHFLNQYQIQICIPVCLMSSEFFYNNFSVFSQIEKSLNGYNCFEDIYIKLKKTELVVKKSHTYLACEFTAH